MPPGPTHLILLPSYNSGTRLTAVVREVLPLGWPVIVVIDGSTDGSEREVLAMAGFHENLSVICRPTNQGKGAAVLEGARVALDRGFTHALVMDSDGQHPAGSIATFMEVSMRNPEALIVGEPIFPDNIPRERLHGRKLSNGLVWVELLGRGINDVLFGFRVYPLTPLLAALKDRSGGRRYDFETEAAVRLAWAGIMPVNVRAPVRYLSREEGGISHFHYVRDNARLVIMHVKLLAELFLFRWPALLRHRRAWKGHPAWPRLHREGP